MKALECPKCGVRKPETAFRPALHRKKDRRCKDCRNAAERAAYSPSQDKARQLKYLYGITLAEYQALYAKQKGRCVICTEWFATLAVDHDHNTGRVRQLLCFGCNVFLGRIEASWQRTERAFKYILKHGGKIPLVQRRR